MFGETFFTRLRNFIFCPKTEYFACAIAFALWPFLAIFKIPFSYRILAVFYLFFAKNNFNVFLETFFPCFRQFYFSTQTEYFVWAIAFALWPFLAIFKMLSFIEY